MYVEFKKCWLRDNPRHKVLKHNGDLSIIFNMELLTCYRMLEPPSPKPMLILRLDVIGGYCRCISAPKQHLKQHCLGGMGVFLRQLVYIEWQSSTVSYLMSRIVAQFPSNSGGYLIRYKDYYNRKSRYI